MTTHSSILTLTGNLLAEHTLEFADWDVGRTQRAQRETFQVGGKGINVAKMLQRLGAPAIALCFAGASSGRESADWLRRQKFTARIFPSSAPTRLGIVVRGGGRAETTFLGPDVPPDAQAIAECAAHLDALPAGQVLALCGSVPGWASPDFDPLRAAFGRWQQRGTLVVDTYGPPLAWLVAQPLALVKINAVELRTLVPQAAPSASTRELLLQVATTSPVRRWVVTDGALPVWYRDGNAEPASVQPPAVREVSPTGSGDVLLACLMASLYLRGTGLAEAVAHALPYAAANAAHPGVADFPLPA